ncbi:MAG TPA: type I glyceraldehyde-3-phosphate dehydrogenase [Moraxellaceae bacterium]|nr:type I glyceraldehyde-3-phosphate dehydrogenase [Moraxellaceae bacterium]
MAIRVAINGYGRIGRNVLRAYFENGADPALEFVAINDLGKPEALAHLTRYDSTHGRFAGQVALAGSELTISAGNATRAIRLLSEPAPEKLPWEALGVDVVLECTGQFRARRDAGRHLQAGARKVIIGAAPFDEVDAMLVYGVNHESLRDSDRILSSVSCTTNALVPLVKILDEAFGVESGLMTEIHAVTSDQVPLDHTHRDVRRGRAAGSNIIPTTSSSIGALRHVLPAAGANIDGYSLRVPTQNVAAIDFSFVARRPVSVAAINAEFAREAAGAYAHILSYCDEMLVSSDFNHSPWSLVFDATETRVVGRQAKVLAWYDNEWGYANRLLDLCHYLASRGSAGT